MNDLLFRTFIPIQPKGKGRPKILRRKTKKGIVPIAITPDATVNAEQAIRWHVSQTWHQAPLDQPLDVTIVAFFIKPISKPKKVIVPAVKPDFDNLAKLVCDSLNGLLWTDDSRIVDGSCQKRYCTPGYPQEGFLLTVRAMPDSLEGEEF